MTELLFLKLGGSLITDKTGVEAVRADVLARLAQEIQQARLARPDLQIVLGHGSGSFGHVAGARHGTRQGVHTAGQWRGFVEVSAAALRLNRLVVEALLAAGVAAISFAPSASVQCADGRITAIACHPIEQALEAGLLPVTHGDVVFDTVRGGTIVSTEEVMMALVAEGLRPSWLLLAGETEGVYDLHGQIIPHISATTFPQVEAALGGSRGADVTGGMVTKVQGMLALTAQFPSLSVRLFSGLQPETLYRALCQPDADGGTAISQAASPITDN
ncbi:MAG: isopentenyl phosphate kinase family protein [Anaerolineae bacterium]|nr:isopentenyl phosphate kinase family protein [Anaerolineae bacterium]